MLNIKILGYRRPARYAVRRVVTSAWGTVSRDYPGADVQIADISSACDIDKYTVVFTLPSLVINEKLVCAGRVPTQDEVGKWLRDALAG